MAAIRYTGRMKPETGKPATVGRVLGTGVRLLGQRVAAPAPSESEARAAAERSRRTGETLGRQTRNVGRGSRAFGRAVWNPFAQASGILWLEITGMFFALFAVLFGQHLWTLRSAYRSASGSEQTHFWVYALFTLLFAYFAVSSFARARRRARRR